MINQLHALILERGIVVAPGPQHLCLMLDVEHAAPSTLLLIEDVRLEWRVPDRRIAALTAEVVARA